MPRRDGFDETYIGDGVYAWFDGYQIWIRADRYGMSHEIALDSQTCAALVAYADRLRAPPTSGGHEGATS